MSRHRLVRQIAAHTRWAKTPDRRAATAPAVKGLLAKFEREVDPDGTLTPELRTQLAENLRKAHMLRLAAKSAETRRQKKTAA